MRSLLGAASFHKAYLPKNKKEFKANIKLWRNKGREILREA
jgi:hypothetical protein